MGITKDNIKNKIIIDNMNINDIYEKCIRWVNKNGKLIEGNRPTYIKALHYGLYQQFEKIGKYITIYLQNLGSGTELTVEIPKYAFHSYGIFNNYSNAEFLEVFEDLYRSIGIKNDKELVNKLYSKSVINSMLVGSLFFSFLYTSMAISPLYVSIFYCSGIFSILFFIFGVIIFIVLSLPKIKQFIRVYKKYGLLTSSI